VLLWDPDGDRLNIVTTAPLALRSRATEFGLTLGPANEQRVVVYLTPNQLYLLLADFRIALLRKSGLLQKYDWFTGTTFPTAMAIEELVRKEGLPVIRVPVGFRNLGDLCLSLEEKMGAPQIFTTLTGQKISLGGAPRALILCEESGGAGLGGPELMRSCSGRQSFLASREKDGMQLALLAWAMAASLHQAGGSMAGRFCDLIENCGIRYRHSMRLDKTLYDEALTGEELRKAKASGIVTRDRVVTFFREAATEISRDISKEEAVRKKILQVSASGGAIALPVIQRAAWIGDGSLFEMEGARMVVRASGTDALIRYYIEATSAKILDDLERFASGVRF
jgi:phosphomannomutase